eukprot:15332077-Ditylum_brightwellii.AAC.1
MSEKFFPSVFIPKNRFATTFVLWVGLASHFCSDTAMGNLPVLWSFAPSLPSLDGAHGHRKFSSFA